MIFLAPFLVAGDVCGLVCPQGTPGNDQGRPCHPVYRLEHPTWSGLLVLVDFIVSHVTCHCSKCHNTQLIFVKFPKFCFLNFGKSFPELGEPAHQTWEKTSIWRCQIIQNSLIKPNEIRDSTLKGAVPSRTTMRKKK